MTFAFVCVDYQPISIFIPFFKIGNFVNTVARIGTQVNREAVAVTNTSKQGLNSLLENVPQDTEEAEIKQEPLPVVSYFTNNSSISQLLNAHEDETTDNSDDEDCVMLNKSVPRPLQATRESLIKYENDLISGNIPFILTVSNFPTRLATLTLILQIALSKLHLFFSVML